MPTHSVIKLSITFYWPIAVLSYFNLSHFKCETRSLIIDRFTLSNRSPHISDLLFGYFKTSLVTGIVLFFFFSFQIVWFWVSDSSPGFYYNFKEKIPFMNVVYVKGSTVDLKIPETPKIIDYFIWFIRSDVQEINILNDYPSSGVIWLFIFQSWFLQIII